MSKWCDEDIDKAVLSLVLSSGENRMPTSKEVRLSTSGLDSAIYNNGGYVDVAKRLGLQMKKKITSWSDEEIKHQIYKVMELLNIKTMPSSEDIKITPYKTLSSAIGKNGGFEHWANKLGIEKRASDSKFGLYGEEFILNEIKNRGFMVEKMTSGYPYDILINNNIKVDVKTSRLHRGVNGNFYSFNLEKHNPTCDIYIMVCVDENDIPKKTIIYPSALLHQTQVSVGELKSKHNKYTDRWDYLHTYDKFYKEII